MAKESTKAKNQSDEKDACEPDGSQPTQNQAEADPLQPYGKKISEGFGNLRGRENWFRQRSGSQSK